VAEFLVHLDTGQAETSVICSEGTRLLQALLHSGLPLRKPCRNGVCGLCRCRLISGEITYQWRIPHGLWDRDIVAGYILPCIAYPLSSLRLDNLSLEIQN